MAYEVWVGMVEVRQLPGTDHRVPLAGKGAFTWITCWAVDAEGYRKKVSEVMKEYGLFVVEVERVMTFFEADAKGLVDDELAGQVDDTNKNENCCIYGTFHGYPNDN